MSTRPTYGQAFEITSVCKDDILQAFRDQKIDLVPNDVFVAIATLSTEDMERLAEKMANDYIEQMFWVSLKIIFEDMFME